MKKRDKNGGRLYALPRRGQKLPLEIRELNSSSKVLDNSKYRIDSIAVFDSCTSHVKVVGFKGKKKNFFFFYFGSERRVFGIKTTHFTAWCRFQQWQFVIKK